MSVKEALAQFQALFDEQKFDEIKEKAIELIDQHPNEIDLYLWAGKACRATQDLSNADYYFIKANFLDDKNIEALLLLAALKVATEEYVDAQEYYEEILAIDPNHINATRYIGDIFY